MYKKMVMHIYIFFFIVCCTFIRTMEEQHKYKIDIIKNISIEVKEKSEGISYRYIVQEAEKCIGFNDPDLKISHVRQFLIEHQLLPENAPLYVTYIPSKEVDALPFKKVSDDIHVVGIIDRYNQPFFSTFLPEKLEIKVSDYKK